MKKNRIIWGIVALVVLLTIAVSFGTKSSYSQKENSNKQNNDGYGDLSKYAVADYDAPLPVNTAERDDRIRKNNRYDKQDWVVKKPHPEDGGVGLFDEIPPVPLIPDAESDLIIVGKVTNAAAYLSNDKTGIYSEFTVEIKQILKNNISKDIESGKTIITDRAGGFVRYSNGQKVLYTNSTKALPYTGGNFLFFLRNDKNSPNYEIITVFELKGNKVIQLDFGRRFDEFQNFGISAFLETVRNKIAESSNNK